MMTAPAPRVAEPAQVLAHWETESAECRHCPHTVTRTRDLSRSWTDWETWVHAVNGRRECPTQDGPA